MKTMQHYNKLCDGFLISFAADSTIKMNKSKFDEVISAALGLYGNYLYPSRGQTLKYTVGGTDKVSDPQNMIATEVALANFPMLKTLADNLKKLYEAYTQGVKFRRPEKDEMTSIYRSDSKVNEKVFDLLVEIYKNLSSFGKMDVSNFTGFYLDKMRNLLPVMSGVDENLKYSRAAKNWADSFNYKRYAILNGFKFYRVFDETLPEFSESRPGKSKPSRLQSVNFQSALKVPAYKAALDKIGLNSGNIKPFSFGYESLTNEEARILDIYFNSLLRTEEAEVFLKYVNRPNQNMRDRQNALKLIVEECVKTGIANLEPQAYSDVIHQGEFEEGELRELQDKPTPGIGEGNIFFSAREPKIKSNKFKEKDKVFYRDEDGTISRVTIDSIEGNTITIEFDDEYGEIKDVNEQDLAFTRGELEELGPRSPLPITPPANKLQPASPDIFEGMVRPLPGSYTFVGIGDEPSSTPVVSPAATLSIRDLHLAKPFTIGEKVTYISNFGDEYPATVKSIKEEEVSSGSGMMGMRKRTIKVFKGMTIEYTDEMDKKVEVELDPTSTQIIRQENLQSSAAVLYSLAEESPLLVASFIKRYVKTKIRG